MNTNTIQIRIQECCAAAEVTPVQSWETIALQCRFRVQSIAQFCHVSTRTLQRHFKKHYDTTVSEWLREVRLAKARRMLAKADCVKGVAFDLGYKQASHFTRDFKQRFGVPPKMWLPAARRILSEREINPGPMKNRAETAISDLVSNC